MARLTRRVFVKNASVGAATVGAMVAVPGLAAAHAGHETHAEGLKASALRGPLAAHVGNVAEGKITILVGTREIVVHDPDLVMRLVKAAQ